MTLILCKKKWHRRTRCIVWHFSGFFLWFRKIISQMFLFSWRFFLETIILFFLQESWLKIFFMHRVSLFGVFKIVSIKFYVVLSWLRGHFQIDLATPPLILLTRPTSHQLKKRKKLDVQRSWHCWHENNLTVERIRLGRSYCSVKMCAFLLFNS